MIGDFLDPFSGDRRNSFVHGPLDQPAIPPVEDIAVERQSVRVPGQVKEVCTLPEQVEVDVGKAEVHLERRRMAAPFAEPLAENEGVVPEALTIIDDRRIMVASV